MKRLDLGPGTVAKVCGLARAEDVDLAVDAGADLLGFVSYPESPRHLSDLVAVALAGRARDAGARPVLVAVDAERNRVDALVESAGFAAVQLCGDERPDDWRGAAYPLLRRIGVADGADAELARWADVACAFVLDHPSSPGGSGRSVETDLAADLARRAPCLLAGGLDGDRLEAGLPAPLVAAPFIGFDASSRLDHEPRRKNPDAVRRFVRAAQAFPPPSMKRAR